jgi:hypothetical protein
MSKQVRETNAAKSIRAYVILNPKGRHVATVQAHYGNSLVMVDVWHNDGAPLQQGRASGYGYDKFTAALSGLVIDGHVMADHCGERLKPPRGNDVWSRDAECKRGYRFSNWSVEKAGWASCHKESGLDYLKALGYTIIAAI